MFDHVILYGIERHSLAFGTEGPAPGHLRCLVAGGRKALDVIGYVANYGGPLAVVRVEFWQMGSVFRGKRGLSDVQTRAALLEFG